MWLTSVEEATHGREPESEHRTSARRDTTDAVPLGAKGTQKGDKRGKKRGSRRRGEEHVESRTVYTSGKPQLEMAVREATQMRKAGRNVIAILNQDHRQGADRVWDLHHWGKGQEWAMHAAEAVKTERGGWSAGVAVLAPRDVPLAIKKRAARLTHHRRNEGEGLHKGGYSRGHNAE